MVMPRACGARAVTAHHGGERRFDAREYLSFARRHLPEVCEKMAPFSLLQRDMTEKSTEQLAHRLDGKRIAILATDGFEQSELTEPRQRLAEAGANTVVVAPKAGDLQGFRQHDKAERVTVDIILDAADPASFDGLMLPGGALSPDALRMNPKAVAFVKSFANAGKPIAAICHGPWTLIEADVVRNRTLTSWPSLKTDLRNAGANWVDQEVVRDGLLVTSRKPADIPAFIASAIEVFSTGQSDPGHD